MPWATGGSRCRPGPALAATTAMQPDASGTCVEYRVRIDAARARLEGQLVVPPRPCGSVVFARWAGGGRHGPWSQALAASLRRDASVATLVVDLLGASEQALGAAEMSRDVPLLARRLLGTAKWAAQDRRTRGLPLGLLGTGASAAAALVTAAERPDLVEAVVTWAASLDLADDSVLARVHAPTLLVVGSDEPAVLEENRRAQRGLPCECRLEVVDTANGLADPGELAHLAAPWFQRHLGGGA